MPTNGWGTWKAAPGSLSRLKDGVGGVATCMTRNGGDEAGWRYVTVRLSTKPWLCVCMVLDADGTLLSHRVSSPGDTDGHAVYMAARNDARSKRGLGTLAA